jgi:predicted transposase YdaD
VYDARLRDGRPVVVYVLFEHKSQPDPLVAFQLLRYQVRLWEEDLRSGRALVPVIPIVVYHGKERWWVALTHGALFDGPELLRPYWPEYRYEVTDVSHLTIEEVRGAILTQVALRIMRSIYDTRQGEDLARITEPMIGMVEQETVPELLKTLLVYVLDANEAVTMADARRAARAVLAEKGDELMATVGETLRREARQEGQRVGLLAGIGVALQAKFGADGRALLSEVAALADLATLEAVNEAILTARTVDDIRAVYRRAAA